MNLNPDQIHFIPYKGCEEFACNFNFYAYKGKWLVMDCGMGIAGKQYPMVDLLLPDPSFIEQYKKDIVGLVVTHAHEDHIGAIPYLWPRLQCPVYCSPFTAEILRRKIKEFPACKKMKITEVKSGEDISLKPFDLSFLDITHSVLDNLSTVIRTDQGSILHTGDWNLDPNPSIGESFDEKKLKSLCKDGVLAYIGDSTNALKPGRTPSEAEVQEGLMSLFKKQKNRIAITTFSSNVGRLRSIAKAAESVGRSVVVMGRSMNNMIGAAKKLGYLDDVQDFLSEEQFSKLPKENVVLMTTGSQGEARAALSRLSQGDVRGVRLDKGDTVIFSSWKIPGNEKEILEVQNRFAAGGIKVVCDKTCGTDRIHASGHPCQDELRDMLTWSKPKIAVPVHGERVMIEAHGQLAKACSVEHVVIPQNGSVVCLDPERPEIIDTIETRFLGVEPNRLIDLDDGIVASRRKLQYTGAAFVSCLIDKRNKLLDDPQMDLIGLEESGSKEEGNALNDIIGEIETALLDLEMDALDDIEEELRIVVRRLLARRYGFKPNVVVHVYRG